MKGILAGSLMAVLLFLTSAGVAHAQTIHVVKQGETIEQIAAEHSLTVEALLAANPDAANLFFAGMQLRIPGEGMPATASAAGFGSLPTAATMRDHYRRSSICLILMVHTDKPYADAMLRVFQDFPMPERYNEHNINLRVVEVTSKQSREDIERMLRANYVGREVVGRWFNRGSDGRMNLDLVHERGGYGAFHDDYVRTVNTVRGTATLRDEGIELLESTFVLVCDMEYAEQNSGFKIGAVIAQIGSMILEGASMYNQYKSQEALSRGDYSGAASKQAQAQALSAGAVVAQTGAEVLDDLSKFKVNIHSYLYRLRWDQTRTASLFNTYWIDDTTPGQEGERRRRGFDNAQFGLDYVGDYSEGSSKTTLVSCTDVDQVVLDVCHRSVEESVKALAERFEIFRPRTPFYCANGMIYSHIGTKEDVAMDKKYEIVKRVRKKDRIEYKRVGEARAGTPWVNTGISFDRYFSPDMMGTPFRLTSGKYDELAQTPGLQIREM